MAIIYKNLKIPMNLLKILKIKCLKKVFSKFLQDEMNEYSEIELMNLAEESLKVCEKILSEINFDLVSINDEYQKLDSIDLNFILDLSLKHIELYEYFNERTKYNLLMKKYIIYF